MTVLAKSEDGITYPHAIAGTIASLAESVYEALLMKGYSLVPEEVEKIITDECRYYSGWAMLEAQKMKQTNIDCSLSLHAYEWALIEPVVMASCDEMQANRVEATGSLGTERFGLSVGEAKQIYNQRRDELPKMAFVAEPYSIDLN